MEAREWEAHKKNLVKMLYSNLLDIREQLDCFSIISSFPISSIAPAGRFLTLFESFTGTLLVFDSYNCTLVLKVRSTNKNVRMQWKAEYLLLRDRFSDKIMGVWKICKTPEGKLIVNSVDEWENIPFLS